MLICRYAYIFICTDIYIYIYGERERERALDFDHGCVSGCFQHGLAASRQSWSGFRKPKS